jgi:hypothetical protein
MSWFTRILTLAFLAFLTGTAAVWGSDERVQTPATSPIPGFPDQPSAPSGVMDRVTTEFNRNAQDVFSDRLHLLNEDNWRELSGRLSGDQIRGERNSRAVGAFADSFTAGVKEAAMSLPACDWCEDGTSFLADFFMNSVDGSDEASVSPLDITYHELEHSWWRRLSQGGMQCGLRAFSTSPYAFASTAIRDQGRLLLLGHLRYYYSNYSEHLCELAVSVPLAYGYAFDLGTSYRFGNEHDEERLVLKLFKSFRSGGILHLSAKLQRNPAVFAGISFPL